MYMESRKMVLMNLFTGQQWRCRHREQMFVDTGNREEGEGGANGESNIIKFIYGEGGCLSNHPLFLSTSGIFICNRLCD